MYNLKSAFDLFSSQLHTRVKKSVPMSSVHMSEDWIRYALFVSLQEKLHIPSWQFSFEEPLGTFLPDVPSANSPTTSSSCEIDCCIRSEEAIKYVFEVKFLRKSGESNPPSTENVGALFKDINRLSHIERPELKKYVLYVTDSAFDSYLRSPERKNNNSDKNLNDFYNLQNLQLPKLFLDCGFIDSYGKTFKNKAKEAMGTWKDCYVKNVYSKDYDDIEYHIRVVEVLPSQNDQNDYDTSQIESDTAESDTNITILDFKKHYWQYYILLERKFINTLSYVELCPENFYTYSNEYAHLLQSIGAELDCFFKVYCGFPLTDIKKVTEYADFILNRDWPEIKTQSVKVGEIELTPFKDWDANKARQSLPFWNAFNNIKHSRGLNMSSASLENVLNALAALYILEMKFFKKLADESISPDVMENESEIFRLEDWPRRYMNLNGVIIEFDGEESA